MVPRASMKEGTPSNSGTPEVLKPRTEKAKVEKVKAEPKPKAVKDKVVKPKAPKAVKPKPETGDGEEAPKVKKAAKIEAKAGEKKVDSKEKVKAVTGDDAVALIVEYLKVQNRPFSATEVSANLHGRVTKTVADKLLKELGDKGTLGMKATNKVNEETGEYPKATQFVFWTPQYASNAATPEELAAMESTITSLKATNPLLQRELKTHTSKLAALRSAPTLSELQDSVEALRASNASRAEKLAGFESGDVKMFSKEEMGAVEKAHRYWSKSARARKNAYMELELTLMEGGMSRGDIREECGVEEDD